MYIYLSIHVSGLLISLWEQLIRFSYTTHMSLPQESVYIPATYKSGSMSNIPFDSTARSK